jgi:DME family drug/metabolite transporter
VSVSESTVARDREHTAPPHRINVPVSSNAAGYLAVLLATACWGTSGIFVKYIVASSDVTALALAFWRDLLTFLTLLTGMRLLRPGWLRVRRRDLAWLAALGGSLGVFHVFWNLGVMINGAAVATVQQAAMPAIVAVAAWLIWREPLTWRKVLAIALAFAGTVLVSGLDALGQVELTPGGLLVGLGIPVTYAGWNLLGKKIRAHYNALTVLTYAFGFGALVLLPLQFFTPQPWPVPPVTWLWCAGLIGVATITPFSVYTFGLGHLPASVASILAMAEIPIVAVYAYVLLDEQLTSSQVLGATLVVGGVLLLIQRRPTIKSPGLKAAGDESP